MGNLKVGNSGQHAIGFDAEELFLTRLLITANSGGGKSWVTRVLIELLAEAGYHCIVLDPEGEFKSLRERFPFAYIGEGGEAVADVRSAGLLAERLLEHRISAVCDLFDLKAHLRAPWVKAFIEGLMNAPKKYWHRVAIFIDEAHMFAPENSKSESFQAVVDICTRGRKRGFCPILITQRLANLSKQATSQLLNRLVGPTFEDVDLDRAVQVLSVSRPDQEEFRNQAKILEPGNFWAFGRAISKVRVLFKVRGVKTSHPKIGAESETPSLPPDKLKSLLPKLSDLPKEAEGKVKTEAELRAKVRELEAELRKKPVPVAPAPAAKPSIQVKPKIVEVPVLSAKQMKELLKLADKLDKERSDLGWTSQRLEIASSALRSSIATVSNSVEMAAKVVKAQAVSTQTRAGAVARPAFVPPAQKRPPADPDAQADMTLLAGERKMLQVLAQFHPGARTKSQLGTLSGYSPSGGTFGTYLSSLRKKGLVQEGPLLDLTITEAGFAAMGGGVPEGPKNTDELLAMWRGKLLAGERKMFDVLVEVYPEHITREELGQRVGFAHLGGTFGTYLSTLRRNQLAVVAKDSVVAAAALFELQPT